MNAEFEMFMLLLIGICMVAVSIRYFLKIK